MSRILVWDSPTRILHWLFAATLTGALVIGFAVDDEHPLFAYHILLGLAAGFVLAVRLVLGVIGSRHGRFQAWAWSPRALMGYLKHLFFPGGRVYVSHHPASTWLTLAMFLVVGLLVATGIVGATKMAREVHEVLAGILIAAIAVHLLGLVWHTARRRENIARSMIDGRKEGPPEAALSSSYRAAGLLVAIAALAWIGALVRGYDAAAGRIRLPLTTFEIQAGEQNNHPEHRAERERSHRHD